MEQSFHRIVRGTAKPRFPSARPHQFSTQGLDEIHSEFSKFLVVRQPLEAILYRW